MSSRSDWIGQGRRGRARFVRARLAAIARSIVLIACTARAPDAGAQTAIEAPEECGTLEEFARQLRELLGDRVSEGWPRSVRITPPDAWGRHTLRIELGDEVRELRDPDCRALFRSAVVIAAAAVRPELRDPSVAPAPDEVPPSANVEPAVPESSPGLPAVPSGGGAVRQTRWQTSVHVAAGAALGLLPGVAPVLELGGSVQHRKWGVLGALRYLPWGKETGEGGRGVTTWAVGGQVGALVEPVQLLRLVAAVAVHRLHGEGFGVADPLADAVWSVSSGIEAALAPFRSDHLRLELGVQASVSIVRPRFEIGGFGEIYRVPPLGGAAIVRGAWLP